MAVKAPAERPEPFQALQSRINSVSSQFSEGGPAVSPSARSSTSSWCDEPVPSNMDISTGHMILVRMWRRRGPSAGIPAVGGGWGVLFSLLCFSRRLSLSSFSRPRLPTLASFSVSHISYAVFLSLSSHMSRTVCSSALMKTLVPCAESYCNCDKAFQIVIISHGAYMRDGASCRM